MMRRAWRSGWSGSNAPRADLDGTGGRIGMTRLFRLCKIIFVILYHGLDQLALSSFRAGASARWSGC